MSAQFDSISQTKITFCDKNYRLPGAIFHYCETALKSHYTAVFQENKHWFWFKTDNAKVSKCS